MRISNHSRRRRELLALSGSANTILNKEQGMPNVESRIDRKTNYWNENIDLKRNCKLKTENCKLKEA
jgi:hypothetical protein